MTLRARIRERTARWARRRQGEDAVPLTLRANRIYILPTRFGVGFALLLFLMLLAGLNYTNSLALLITFAFAGFLMVSMHECHRTLRGLQLVHAEAADSFAGTAARLELRFNNPSPQPRQMLQLQCQEGHAQRFELPAGALTVHFAHFQLPRRGRQRLGRIALRTTAPLGLFRAWTWLHLPLDAIAYPAPAGDRPLPSGGGDLRRGDEQLATVGDQEWSALRPFNPGDSPRSVAWKLYARGAPLLVSQYQGESGQQRTLNFAELHGLDIEARLSQLAAWIVQCERQQQPYRLRLPDQELPVGMGSEQQRTALRALALFNGGAS